ncbi:hypothetical protein Tco_0798238 [Tanacetum coccineum]
MSTIISSSPSHHAPPPPSHHKGACGFKPTNRVRLGFKTTHMGAFGGDTCEGYIFITARVFLEGTLVMGTYGFHYCLGVLGGDTYDGLVPSCYVIFDLEPLSLSFDFVFTSEIFKSLFFSLDRLCLLAILCLDQHAHTLYHLESLLTISLDRLDILKEDLFKHEHVVMNPTLAGMGYRHHRITCKFTLVIINRYGRECLCALAVLVIGESQSRQHGKSESDSYYLSD